MTTSPILLLWALCVARVAAFSGPLDFELDADGCITSFDPSVDYFPPERRAMFVTNGGVVSDTVQYAEDFSIEYLKTFKVLRNLKIGSVHVLRQCGVPPTAELEGLPDDAADATVFDVPIKGWSTGSTISVGFGEDLGVGSLLAVADTTYVTAPCVQKRLECDAIQHTASWDSANWPANVNSSSELNLIDRFNTGATGLPIDVPFDATGDPGMLARVEWIKFLAAFFNKEPEANIIFQETANRFDDTAKRVEESVLASRAAGQLAPRIAYVTFAPGRSWNGFVESWFIDVPAYLYELGTKAGGRFLAEEAISAICPLDNDQWSRFRCNSTADVKQVLRDVDVLIDQSYAPDPRSYTMDTFLQDFGLANEDPADFPFLRESKMLRFDGRIAEMFPGTVGNDWFESAIPRADQVLADLASYLTPDAVPDHESRFVRNLAEEEEVTLVDETSCTDPQSVCPGEDAPPPDPPVYNLCIENSDLCFIGTITFNPSPPSPIAPPSPPPSSSDDDLPGWALALIIIFSVLALCFLVTIMFLIVRERSGQPMFAQNMAVSSSTDAQKKSVEVSRPEGPADTHASAA